MKKRVTTLMLAAILVFGIKLAPAQAVSAAAISGIPTEEPPIVTPFDLGKVYAD